MTLPAGTISMSQVNTELGRPATQGISLNDGQVRALAGKPSGAISMSDLRGKSSAVLSTTMTAGGNGPEFGYAAGYYGAIGNTNLKGVQIGALTSDSGKRVHLVLVGLVGATFIKTMEVNGTALPTSSASFSTRAPSSGGYVSEWEWPAGWFVFSSGSTYTLRFFE